MNRSVKQAAERIGISVALMYALLGRKMIRHERHGLGRGRYVITDEAIEEYCRSREVGAGELPAPLRHIRVRAG